MKVEWDSKIGPASVVGALGIAIQVIVVVWMGSSIYTKLTDKIENQGIKIDEIDKGSRQRFASVRTALATYQTNESAAGERVGRLETALSYVSEQIRRVEARLDGATPPAPALPPPGK